MKSNVYDNEQFYSAYAQMDRSLYGLKAAGEWAEFQRLLPDNLNGIKALDLGCGYGWHCRFLREQGADYVVGIDLSQKMLQQAEKMTQDDQIEYSHQSIEDFDLGKQTFDLIISSLAFHYIKDFNQITSHIVKYLKKDGQLIFSVEHPIFTARAEQDWIYIDGEIAHWPVDHYQDESIRKTEFLQHPVIKYHRNMATYINTLIENNLSIEAISEPVPSQAMIDERPNLAQELRRPMMLIIKAKKKAI